MLWALGGGGGLTGDNEDDDDGGGGGIALFLFIHFSAVSQFLFPFFFLRLRFRRCRRLTFFSQLPS